MIDELGQHAFRDACKMARLWPDLNVAVNLSPVQFRAPRFAAIAARDRRGRGRRAVAARARDHREPVHRAWLALRLDHPGAAPRRLPHRPRRFRHRLFLAVLPAPLPGRQDQARPLVHRHRRARPERRDHPRRGHARPCDGPRSGRRGHFLPRGRADRARSGLRRPAGPSLRARPCRSAESRPSSPRTESPAAISDAA